MKYTRSVFFIMAMMAFAQHALAQTTEFNYQGSLSAAGVQASGNFDFEFALYTAIAGGKQVGNTLSRGPIAVASGVFDVKLDFGDQFSGADRFLEISVRPAGQGAFTTLAPRQQIGSTPYSIRTISAGAADALSPACVGCVQDSHIESVAGTKIIGEVPIKSFPGGSGNYIQNTVTPQLGSSFNIDGSGTVGLLKVNGDVSLGGIAPPATAPAGEGRIYFDGKTNKVRVSENGSEFIDLVGAGGVSGNGAVDSIPVWSGGTTLGNSLITQTADTVQLPNRVELAATAQGNNITFGSPNFETGMTIAGPVGRADVRFDGSTMRLSAGAAGGPPGGGIGVQTNGFVTMPNTVLFAAGAQGNNVQMGSPSGETGMSISGPVGRADLRFDGSSLKLVAGSAGFVPPAANGLSISTAGNVTVGTYSGSAAKLMVGGGDIGIAGTTSVPFGQGVRGFSTANNASGVAGISELGSGVVGQSNSGSGLLGLSNTGFALEVIGNARQSLLGGGLVKAMALIRVTRTSFPTTATAAVLRCYNSVNNTSSGNCGIGFQTVYTSIGVEVNFGFTINDRFVMVSGNSGGSVSTAGFLNSSTVTVIESGTNEFFIFIL